ncbi:GDYXXLXY domain-containing protein [Paenibacillus sp. IB182496]|uniref:GDYXXLXY domain-containing protein n=1 Tax=Paenibacillus sabuli TaxID=2772509 RepID=A0A927BRH7_9BACL|nr:GDYXXLXY domain-containing protein [Paenibacillus sabuli]MBD2844209.1 GDYXXLXY domain-containing protein [Paenibacillus sabuli]
MIRSKGRRWIVWAAVGLQLLALVLLAASNAAVERYGTEIRLETAPVDPRDLFYGDYVTLSYEISTLPQSMWRGDTPPKTNERAYVLLRERGEGDGVFEAVGVYRGRPSAGAGEAVLPARLDYIWGDQLQLEYGLERYYVPEGTGKALEERADSLLVAVKLAPWGQVKLSGLVEDKAQD